MQCMDAFYVLFFNFQYYTECPSISAKKNLFLRCLIWVINYRNMSLYFIDNAI
jgi:hypothetical protein